MFPGEMMGSMRARASVLRVWKTILSELASTGASIAKHARRATANERGRIILPVVPCGMLVYQVMVGTKSSGAVCENPNPKGVERLERA